MSYDYGKLQVKKRSDISLIIFIIPVMPVASWSGQQIISDTLIMLVQEWQAQYKSICCKIIFLNLVFNDDSIKLVTISVVSHWRPSNNCLIKFQYFHRYSLSFQCFFLFLRIFPVISQRFVYNFLIVGRFSQ